MNHVLSTILDQVTTVPIGSPGSSSPEVTVASVNPRTLALESFAKSYKTQKEREKAGARPFNV
jgi:hypothetical protein